MKHKTIINYERFPEELNPYDLSDLLAGIRQLTTDLANEHAKRELTFHERQKLDLLLDNMQWKLPELKIKNMEQAPPGIVAYIDLRSGKVYPVGDWIGNWGGRFSDYNSVYKYLMDGTNTHAIQTIEVDGRQWSVGEKYLTKSDGDDFTIKELAWSEKLKRWQAMGESDGYEYKYWINELLPSTPQPSEQPEEKKYTQSEMTAAIYNTTELAEFCKNKEFEKYRAQLENLIKENYDLKKPSQEQQLRDCLGELIVYSECNFFDSDSKEHLLIKAKSLLNQKS